ncbi:MAG: hypothetical protein JG769_814 [Oscillospiraceae bacterium]|jgi:CRISPR/Cas system CSM-associated protein Csm3 (group 7 of RAMP superfamily)|nr:hypothetical protein [Oscillospiraceae bacterium]
MKNIKYYFTATFIANSPIHVGSGLDENSDSDILIDASKMPVIPATAIAGKIRHYLKSCNGEFDFIFGKGKLGKNIEDVQSDIIFYDAVFDGEDNQVISIRDNVKIDEKGIAENGAKFDYEIVEPGARFNFRAELICENLEFAHKIFSEIVQGFNCGDILLGAKTSRGLGRILIINPKYMAIDLSKNIKDYIDFNWEKVSNEFISAKKNLNLYETLKIKITVNTFIFIRNYACVTPDKLNNNKLVDAEQLSHQDGSAVIPGTSWAGVFRHHFERILNKTGQSTDLVKEIFGDVDEQAKYKKSSKIIFSESIIKNSNMHNRTRTAIDRFTGSAGDGLLFTTRPCYGGEGELIIKLLKNFNDINKVKNLIDICIRDFNAGFLNIGGEGSIGGGFIKMEAGAWQ